MAKKSLEEQVQRVLDFQEIQNIMGRYAYFIMANMQKHPGELLFARKAQDVRVYFGEQGYFEGPDAPDRAWGNYITSMRQ